MDVPGRDCLWEYIHSEAFGTCATECQSAGRVVDRCRSAAGVFNILHGDKTVVDVLLKHPVVRAISFVGSTPVAKYIYETGCAHGKRVQSAGGAKNHILIMPDADLEQAALAVQASAFGCAGERCMAGSIAVPIGRAAEPLLERLVDIGQKMRTGPTDTDAAVDMGPLITRAHQQRVASYLEIAGQEGAKVALDGRQVAAANSEGFFVGPSIVDRVGPDMRLAREEIFGPVLSVCRVDDLDAALAVGKKCTYGNGASIFTKSGWAARQFKQYFNAGMIGINIGVPAPMAWFPSPAGMNHSLATYISKGWSQCSFIRNNARSPHVGSKVPMNRTLIGVEDAEAEDVRVEMRDESRETREF